jgi:ribose transport system substrate-binding protein
MKKGGGILTMPKVSHFRMHSKKDGGVIKLKKIKFIGVFCLALLVTASVGLTGCQKSSTGKTTKGYVIGFSNFGVGNSWRVQMEAEFKADADNLKSQGIISNYYMTDSNGDIAKQISDVKDLITKKVNAIVITAASPSALSPVCEQAEKAGIKVVSFDNIVNTNKITAKVDIDEVAFGTVGAQWLATKLNGKGNIIVLNGTSGTATNDARYKGAKDVFAKYPNIKVLGNAYAAWDYAQGKTATESFLSAYPKIDGVWSQGGAMTQGALDAFKAAGRPLVPMSGEANNGLLKEWQANLKSGFDSIAPCCPTYVSASALDTAIQALQGKTVKLTTVITLPTITDANLSQYVRTDLPDSFWNITKLTTDQISALYKNS